MKKMFTQIVPLLATLLVLGGAATGAAAQQAAADAAAGEKKAAMCIGCHGIPGYQASFPEIHKVPMISGQGAAYLASALNAYRKGDRKHPTMRSVAASLTDQDILDLSAFYEKQGAGSTPAAAAKPAEPSPQVAALLKKGTCVACHGENFSKPIDPTYPKLSGQHADYLFVALKSYQTVGNANVGRANPVMAAQVQNFSHAELKEMAKYLASLETELKVVQQSRFR
jgi:cytochrome c553